MDISRRGALSALVALLRGEPLDAMAFAAAAEIDPKWSARLRADLDLLGLISAKVVREQGAVREYEIRLTQRGREVAHHLAQIEEILRKRH